jgi:hypothetical protein
MVIPFSNSIISIFTISAVILNYVSVSHLISDIEDSRSPVRSGENDSLETKMHP